MALTEKEQILLDVIEAWCQAHPDLFGPILPEIEGDYRALYERRLGTPSELKNPWVDAGLLDLKAKGLLKTWTNANDWRRPMRWRVVGLLDRLAHEADDGSD